MCGGVMLSVQPVGMLKFTNFSEFDNHRRSSDAFFAHTISYETKDIHPLDDYILRRYCGVCCLYQDMGVSKSLAFMWDGLNTPLWRETVHCPGCGLNNRMRGLLHIMSAELGVNSAAKLYFTEQITATFRAALTAWPASIGSEFLRDGTPRGGVNAAGVRCEDLTALTFASDLFDGVVSMDVIEHVPDYVQGLREAFRVLKPGGRLILSAPFDLDAERSVVRARVTEDGAIEHLLPAEYHGDPLDESGLLCFTTFGWDLFDTLRTIGFAAPSMNFYWSERYGYHGVQYVVLATKPPALWGEMRLKRSVQWVLKRWPWAARNPLVGRLLARYRALRLKVQSA